MSNDINIQKILDILGDFTGGDAAISGAGNRMRKQQAERFRQELSAKEKELASIQSEISSKSQELADLEQQIYDKQSSIMDLASQIQDCEQPPEENVE